MGILDLIKDSVIQAVNKLYNGNVDPQKVIINPTRKEFKGDYTVTVFAFSRIARKKPEAIGTDIGQFIVDNVEEIASFNVIKGFLNLSISNTYWSNFLVNAMKADKYGTQPRNGKKVMVEYSSPNTNKPLHLGHIRNNLLGWSVSKLLDAAGYDVTKVQIINDRGVHICKSMLAWKLYGNGETPTSSGIKGDFLVGKYYVRFDKELQKEYAVWQKSDEAKELYEKWLASDGGQKAAKGKTDLLTHFFKKVYKNKYFNENSALGKSVKEMLQKWEANDATIRNLWETMNGWVYDGFEKTYKDLGVSFDKYYYESNTYLLGKDTIDLGLEKSIFYKQEDGSVWTDLTDAKLDKKLVLRSNGTSVYITQDLGTAQLRYEDFGAEKMIYVVGDEQEYHFKVLFEILKRLKAPYADGLYHLSYGMVDLPSGKMKSREGKVVDADDLMAEVINEAKKQSEARETDLPISDEEKATILRQIGLGALKFFILKVNPKKRMVFNPAESVDMQGHTGPYVQNAYVRISSLHRKAKQKGYDLSLAPNYLDIQPQEIDLLLKIQQFPPLILDAAENYDPSSVANFCYDLAKSFHKLWHDLPILRSDTAPEATAFRLNLAEMVGRVLETGLDVLGIEVPEYM